MKKSMATGLLFFGTILSAVFSSATETYKDKLHVKAIAGACEEARHSKEDCFRAGTKAALAGRSILEVINRACAEVKYYSRREAHRAVCYKDAIEAIKEEGAAYAKLYEKFDKCQRKKILGLFPKAAPPTTCWYDTFKTALRTESRRSGTTSRGAQR